MKYIDKKDCESAGFIRLADGAIYRQTVLEKYRDKGWLSFGSKNYSPDDRLKSGCRLAQDYYCSRFRSEGIIDYTRPRVDNSIRGDLSPAALDARTRYLQAISLLDQPQSYVVRKVCCDNESIKIPNIRKDQYIHDLELLKETICRALDRLTEHYWGKIISRRPQILGYAEVGFWDDIDKYYQELGK